MADLTKKQIKEGWALLGKNNADALTAACKAIDADNRRIFASVKRKKTIITVTAKK